MIKVSYIYVYQVLYNYLLSISFYNIYIYIEKNTSLPKYSPLNFYQ